MNISKKRNNALTIYTALMCLMVIFVHISSEGINTYNKASQIYALLYFLNKFFHFVVPGFIFISAVKYFMGFAQNPSKKFDYPKFLWGRFTKIYIPYLIWTALYYLYFVYYRLYFPFSFEDLLHYIVFGDLAAQFYFVIIIMQFYILMPLWRVAGKIKNKKYIVLFLTACTLITCFVRLYLTNIIIKITGNADFRIIYNDRIFTSYLIYFVLGIFCGLYYDKFVLLLKKYRPVNCAIFCAITATHTILSYISSRELFNFHYKYTEHVYIFFCLSALLFVYDLCIIISDKIEKSKKFKIILMPTFKILSEASFYMFLVHVMVIFTVDYIMDLHGATSTAFRFITKFFVTYIVTIQNCVIYVKVKQKIRSIYQ